MLKQLVRRITFEVVGLAMLAFATGVAVISAAYGLYAVLRASLSAAASAGLTSIAAIILMAVLAVSLILMGKTKSAPPKAKRGPLDPDTVQQAMTVGAAVMGVLADTVLQWRLEHRPDKHGRSGRGKRR